MKSTEVYALLKSELGPWFKAAGFKRADTFLSWSRPHGNLHITAWCQVSRDGWDEYSGSKFVVEFQLAPDPIVGASATRRQRLARLLTPEQREAARRIENEVIASLKRPPKTHPSLHVSPEVTRWYLAKFDTVSAPYPEGHDIWLRYAKPEHVSGWAQFILPLLPGCVSAVEAWG
ncbi:hypothetical protein [Niveibacterium sp. COAC-50]|uniref:hypothetical protein n=1 Tax=Niveibacterium sp. COAC-50 TaxID=2729384 RepID=UPI001556F7E8|nr:hypothetical protein [Niveibacterium sp. COAC-50]